jgi:hypothetical protein
MYFSKRNVEIPYYSHWESSLQKLPMVMRAKERGKSECQSVMGWIEVETLPHAKAG